MICRVVKNKTCSFYKWWNNISEFNIRRNDIFEECTLFGYAGEEDIIQILNYRVLLAKYFIYTNKLDGNNTSFDLYSYLVLTTGLPNMYLNWDYGFGLTYTCTHIYRYLFYDIHRFSLNIIKVKKYTNWHFILCYINHVLC